MSRSIGFITLVVLLLANMMEAQPSCMCPCSCAKSPKVAPTPPSVSPPTVAKSSPPPTSMPTPTAFSPPSLPPSGTPSSTYHSPPSPPSAFADLVSPPPAEILPPHPPEITAPMKSFAAMVTVSGLSVLGAVAVMIVKGL